MEELMKKLELEIINKINYDNFFFTMLEGWKNGIDLVIEKCTELYMKNYNTLKNHDQHIILKNDNDVISYANIKDICKLLEHIIISKQTGIINISTNCFL